VTKTLQGPNNPTKLESYNPDTGWTLDIIHSQNLTSANDIFPATNSHHNKILSYRNRSPSYNVFPAHLSNKRPYGIDKSHLLFDSKVTKISSWIPPGTSFSNIYSDYSPELGSKLFLPKRISNTSVVKPFLNTWLQQEV